MIKLRKIISGGQTGVDRAALDAAMKKNFPVAGWCPKGRRAEDGPINLRYPLKETTSDKYQVRTELNVRDSDGTLIVCKSSPSGGTALTIKHAREHGKALLIIDLLKQPDPEQVRQWILDNDIDTLNIAGPRESQSPGIYLETIPFIERVITLAGHLSSTLPQKNPYYPIFLALDKRPCLVVGGGAVAWRKIEGLLACGAQLTVVALNLVPEIEKVVAEGKIAIRRRAFDETDLEKVFLVYAATDNPKVNAKVLTLSQEQGILAAAVDKNWTNGDFITPARFTHEGVTVAVSSDGKSCCRSRDIKNELQSFLRK